MGIVKPSVVVGIVGMLGLPHPVSCANETFLYLRGAYPLSILDRATHRPAQTFSVRIKDHDTIEQQHYDRTVIHVDNLVFHCESFLYRCQDSLAAEARKNEARLGNLLYLGPRPVPCGLVTSSSIMDRALAEFMALRKLTHATENATPYDYLPFTRAFILSQLE